MSVWTRRSVWVLHFHNDFSDIFDSCSMSVFDMSQTCDKIISCQRNTRPETSEAKRRHWTTVRGTDGVSQYARNVHVGLHEALDRVYLTFTMTSWPSLGVARCACRTRLGTLMTRSLLKIGKYGNTHSKKHLAGSIASRNSERDEQGFTICK